MTFGDDIIKELLQDELFRKWVTAPDNDTITFGENWLAENPGKQDALNKAREILLIIGDEQHTPAAYEQQEVWARIKDTIHRVHAQPQTGPRIFPAGRWLKYAAAFVVIFGAAITGYLFYGQQTVNYSTAYGEIKTIVLPDSSVVKLNAHSTLTYRSGWPGNRSREVWLGGEAFFSIVHKSSNQRFIVHTTDVNVQVTGTTFNVNTRQVRTRVVLNSGAVKLSLNRQGSPAITMKPGDMVTYSAATKQLSNKQVNAEDYASWRNNILTFNEASLAEVAASLQDNLGINIRFEDTTLQQQTFTGSIPMDDVAIFFKTLSRSFNVVVENENHNNYVIREK